MERLTLGSKYDSGVLARAVCCRIDDGEFHDQGDAKWIVIRGQLGVKRYALRAYLVVELTINK
jgi:hypothetical protein